MSLPDALNPVQKYMLRLVLFNARKTIQYKNRICEVVDTHEQLHCLLPLVNEDLTEATSDSFWTPRRALSARQMRNNRICHQYRCGVRKVFVAPHWTGDSRPQSARTVRLRSVFPPPDYLRRLVSELGYDGRAAMAALSHAHKPWTQTSGRLASPIERTTHGGFKKLTVTKAIAKHRWDDKHSTAVFEIVYLRRKPFLVAASLGLKLTTVYQYTSRIRADLRREQASHNGLEEADLHEEDSNPLVFSECV